MADISQIIAPNNAAYNIKDATARDTLDKQAHVFYVAGPTTDSAGVWTGSIEGLTVYYDGLTIIYTTGVAGKSGSTSLNINNIGAIPCYLTDKGSITALTTHYPAGTPIPFTYVNGKFIHADYSRANDNTTVIHTLYHQNGNFVANSVIYRYQLLFHVDADKLTPLNNVSNGYKNTTKTILTNVEFDPYGEIFYYNTTTTIEANAAVGNGSLYYSFGSVDLRYSLNISATVNALTANEDVYIKVSPQSSGKVKLAAAFPLVQALPSSADGYWYIFLGRAYSTYQISLYPHHPVYYHNGISLVQKLPDEAENGKIWYGVCDTAAATQEKTITISGITEYTEGMNLRIKFVNSSTSAQAAKLNVNNLGAKYISYRSDLITCPGWGMNETLDLVYDGSYFLVAGGGIATTSNYGITMLSDSVTSNSSAGAATSKAVKTAYDLAASKQSALTFDSAPTVNSSNPVTSSGIYDAIKAGKIFYGTCDSQWTVTPKVVTVSGFPSSYEDGMNLRVKFTYGNEATSTIKIQIGDYSKTIYSRHGSTANLSWDNGAVLDFVYNSGLSGWILVNGTNATTSHYGTTKLSSAIDSSSEDIAATPKAVKDALDYVYTYAQNKIEALEAKNTVQTLADVQNVDALDGVYMYNRTPRLYTLSQERITRYGDIISMRLLLTVKAVNDSGTNAAWSCAGNSLKTICTTSLIPAFPYRVPVFDNNDQGTICGILTLASSNGNISFQPSYRIKTSGSSTTTVTQLAAGEELTIQAYATYPLKVED